MLSFHTKMETVAREHLKSQIIELVDEKIALVHEDWVLN